MKNNRLAEESGLDHEAIDEYSEVKLKLSSMKKEDIIKMLIKSKEVMEWVKDWQKTKYKLKENEVTTFCETIILLYLIF